MARLQPADSCQPDSEGRGGLEWCRVMWDSAGHFPPDLNLVTCRIRWQDHAQYVTSIISEVEGVPLEIAVGHELAEAVVEVEVQVLAQGVQGMAEVADDVRDSWWQNMQPLQRETCALIGVQAFMGAGTERQAGTSVQHQPIWPQQAEPGHPVATAVLLTLQTSTGRPRPTGRLHVPGGKSVHIDSASGWMKAYGASQWQQGIAAWKLAMEAHGLWWVVANPRLRPDLAHLVTGMTIHRQLVAQRRRRYAGFTDALTRVTPP